MAEVAVPGRGAMWEVVHSPIGQVTLWSGILILIAVLAIVVMRKLRESAMSYRQDTEELLSNFQEMRREGDINDAEFRNIQAVLGNQLGRDVKSGKDKL